MAETITFYSYKGGTGRSLVVSHVANYLSSFGKRVVAIDFDLEAPGLHFKLGLNNKNAPATPQRGLLDLMFDSLKRAAPLPESLDDYAPVVVRHDSGGWIRLLAAGNNESRDYWGRLAQINWHDAFYAPDGLGVPFFLELIGRVDTELEPDYILIDSRTGVTEIGGVATSILPDRLVCLFTNSLESLQGTRNVIRSVAVAPRLPSKPPIDILPVLTRIPELDKETEASITEAALVYLNEATERPEATHRFNEIFVLHSEPSLQVKEKLLTTGDESKTEPPLLRDYLRLFSRLIPSEVIEPWIGPLVQNAFQRIVDDPDGVQKDLESLARFYPHPMSQIALLKVYRLREKQSSLILKTAARLHQLTQDVRDPYLLDTVRSVLKSGHLPVQEPGVIDLVDAVWSQTGDLALALVLISYHPGKSRALELISAVADLPDLSPTQVVRLINVATSKDLIDPLVDRSLRLASKYHVPEIHAALVRMFIDRISPSAAKQFIDRSGIDLEMVRRTDPIVALKLAAALGNSEARDAAAQLAVRIYADRGDVGALEEVGRFYGGEWERFESMLRAEPHGEDLLRYVKLELRR